MIWGYPLILGNLHFDCRVVKFRAPPAQPGACVAAHATPAAPFRRWLAWVSYGVPMAGQPQNRIGRKKTILYDEI